MPNGSTLENVALEEEASESVEAPFLKILNMKGPQQPELIWKLMHLQSWSCFRGGWLDQVVPRNLVLLCNSAIYKQITKKTIMNWSFRFELKSQGVALGQSCDGCCFVIFFSPVVLAQSIAIPHCSVPEPSPHRPLLTEHPQLKIYAAPSSWNLAYLTKCWLAPLPLRWKRS